MEIRGIIRAVLPLQQGTSKTGNPWKKQEYVLETQEQYPRKVKFDLFGDRVDQFPLQVNEDVVVSFDLESREFNGRWYTDVRGYKVVKAADAVPTPENGQAPQFASPQPAVNFAEPVIPQMPGPAPAPSATDDLPF